MNLDYEAIGVSVAIIAALTAIFAAWTDHRRSRFLHGLDILYKTEEIFGSERYSRKRKDLARLLLKKRKGLSLTKGEGETLERLGWEIMDHFQGLGLFMRRGLLDTEFVYSDYSYLIFHYWKCLQDVIDRNRKEDELLWEDAVWMYKKLRRLDRKYRPRQYKTYPGEASIDEFLDWEMKN
jgi:hypothetical protein